MSLLETFNQSLPRYTSYPTAPAWEEMEESSYRNRLASLPETTPLSLYFHIPFCASMCLFCGCSVILNRKQQVEEEYVELLMEEISLVTKVLGKKRETLQLHFGGGTPTKLNEELLTKLFAKITAAFDVNGEIAIEIDPRTVWEDKGSKLRLLRRLGFNRVSFGVQDMDEQVQEGVKRRQSREMTISTFELSKSLGFNEINLDLIYGLPFQTEESFGKTIEEIILLAPDRIALFSYAKIPHLKPHQKAIREETLPTTDVKFAIYTHARKRLIERGYVAIGMDHFALPTSELAKSYQEKRLHRNFQGYTVLPAPALIGLGVTAIGSLQSGYFQNVKEIASYRERLSQGHLPVLRGKILTEEDLLRRWVIEQLMCTFEVDKKDFRSRFGMDFDTHFPVDWGSLKPFVEERKDKLVVNPSGELFIRNIASRFDAYLGQTGGIHSKAI